jgi:predicted metal-dependent RNase
MIINEKNFLGDNMNYLLEALIKKLEGEIEVHKANVMVYVKNPAGIGEHSDVVESIEKEIEKVADAEDKIEAIMKHFKY